MTHQTSADLKADFRNFLFLAWSHLGLPKPTKVQYEIADYLQKGPRRKVIQAFRGVGKSWITAAYVVWRLYCDPQKKFLVVSGSKVLADNFSTFCLQIINLIPELDSLRPNGDGREAKVQFDVGGATASKDPSVRSVGITGMLTGSRADEIIADDIESANNSQTQLMRDKLSEAVKEFDAILKPDGKITYLGTPQCEQSIYNTLPGRGYSCRIWPARYPDLKAIEIYGDRLSKTLALEVTQNHKLVGHTTDPDRFTDMDLAEREASYGRSGFALQFMLDTSLSDANRYPLKLADLVVMSVAQDMAPEKVVHVASPEMVWNDLPNVGFGGDRLYRPMFVSKDQFAPYQGAVLAIDPSGRGKDETGYAVVKMLHSTLYVTAWGGLLGGYSPETLRALALIAKTNKVNHVLIESNFGDGMFTSLFGPHLAQAYPCGIEEIRHSTQKEKRIIDTLEPVMNQHRLVIDRKLVEEDYRSTQGLSVEAAQKYQGLYQLTRITKDRGSLTHDDRLDALSMAVGYWVEQMAKDQDMAVADHRRELLDKELKEFLESATGRLGAVQEATWLTS